MNIDRRQRLNAITDQLGALGEQLEALRDEEQQAYDSLPESLQSGEKGQAMDAARGNLDDALEELESVMENIGLAVEG